MQAHSSGGRGTRTPTVPGPSKPITNVPLVVMDDESVTHYGDWFCFFGSFVLLLVVDFVDADYICTCIY